MKKVLLTVLTILSAQQSLACIGEAKITARVIGSSLTGSTACKVMIDPNSITEYKKNIACPLDVHAVFQNGIEVGVRREDICRFDNGEILSGFVAEDSSGNIHLK